MICLLFLQIYYCFLNLGGYLHIIFMTAGIFKFSPDNIFPHALIFHENKFLKVRVIPLIIIGQTKWIPVNYQNHCLNDVYNSPT